MSKPIKTQRSKASVNEFIASLPSVEQIKDAKVLLKIFNTVTGEKPAMWGTSIIGYGSYHYESTRSAQKGDWPLTAFSPRAKNLSIYIMPGFAKHKELLKKLGSHKTGVSCLYIKRLSDVDTSVLTTIIERGYEEMKKKYNK